MSKCEDCNCKAAALADAMRLIRLYREDARHQERLKREAQEKLRRIEEVLRGN